MSDAQAISDNLSSSDRRVATAGPDALALTTPAMQRVLAALARRAEGGEWFEATQYDLAAECRLSRRDAIPLLTRLADLRLIRVRVDRHLRRASGSHAPTLLPPDRPRP